MTELDARQLEQIVSYSSVYDDLAADPPALACFERFAVGDGWTRFVHSHGGEPVGEPELSRMPNARYGQQLVDAFGHPVCDEDGIAVLDRVKFVLVARGHAYRIDADRPETPR